MLISFEGTEGVGKSTLIRGLQQQLDLVLPKPVVITREPGGTPLAENIRQLLLTPEAPDEPERMAIHTELLLLYAARVQHIEHVLQPAITAGRVILCDRFIDATMAYQCGGRGLPQTTITLLNQQFVTVMPNMTFWLDAPVEVGMQRAQQRGQLDRFEHERVDFFQRVRAVYADLYRQYPERIIRLDATLDAEHLLQAALTSIMHNIQ